MTNLDQLIQQVESALDAGSFSRLFIEILGWSNPRSTRSFRIKVEEGEFEVFEAAHKKGLAVMVVAGIPPTRKAMDDIDRELAKRAIERIVVFRGESEQIWRWPESRKSGGVRYLKHVYRVGRRGQDLAQRLASCKFTLSEEPDMNIIKVRERIRSTFNSDEVTKRFYTKFKQHQSDLAKGIKGLKSESERSWYSSLLLNRLMFIYFMQKKGFLNNDLNYLRTSLIRIREVSGKNKFFDFYRDFLLPLFHDELGAGRKPAADSAILEIIGEVPYINGGIFAEHVLESTNAINIKDSYFSEVFDFFDQFRWHLDERPSGNPGEINPDVIGYIFEQYINQKQQGAYYTKEDVTGYMTISALVPVIVDRFLEHDPAGPWSLLAANPDAYIFDPLRYGSDLELPTAICNASLEETGVLDTSSADAFGLPGERWRETIERLDYYRALKRRLETGEVSDSSQLVSLNLDILTLLCDWIATIAEPSVITQMWDVLLALNVIDPTCGSGAFLFSALDVLEEIYTAILTRAEELVQTASGTAKKNISSLLSEMNAHPSREYFLLKTIVLENLYGVDIMVEATEIARLRLFLALAARLDTREQIEPLPDLDMNIKVGNILIGCSTLDDVRSKFSKSLLEFEDVSRISSKAHVMKSAYDEFVRTQRTGGSHLEVVRAKLEVQELTAEIRDELDRLYFSEVAGAGTFETWKEKSVPFHWFVEFPETMLGGGFDVVIGNPPHIKKSKIKGYRYSGFETDDCPDIFAPCLERSSAIVSAHGALAMIVMHNICYSEDFSRLRTTLSRRFSDLHVSSFGRIPSCLFAADTRVRNTIVIGRHTAGPERLMTTRLHRWKAEFRSFLLPTLRYSDSTTAASILSSWPFSGDSSLLESMVACNQHLPFSIQSTRGLRAYDTNDDGLHHGTGLWRITFKVSAYNYMPVFVDIPPKTNEAGVPEPHTKIANLWFDSRNDRDLALTLLCGRIGFWWWITIGDDFDLTSSVLQSVRVDLSLLSNDARTELLKSSKALRKRMRENPTVKRNRGMIYNWYMPACKDILDGTDRIWLRSQGLGHLEERLRLATSLTVRTDDRSSDDEAEA